MAFLVAEPIALTPTTTAAANYPITISSLGLTLVDDDWLILSVACAATSGTLSTASSGWSEITTGELGVTSGNRMARYKAKVASGTVGDVQIDLSAGTGQWSGCIEQWRDADATDCIDSAQVSAGSSGGAVTSEASGTLTPGTNNCAISYFSSSRLSGVGTALRFKPDEVVGRLIQSADDGTVYRSICLGTVQQTTAAATAKTVYVEKSSRIGTITVAIKNKTSGGIERDCRAGVEKMAWMGTFGTTHESLGTTWGAPSTFVAWTGGTIGGITADTNAPTISNDQVVGGLAWGAWTSVSSNVSTAGAIVGGWIALPSTIDLTGKFISLEWFQSLLGALFGAEGVFLALGDSASASTGNAVVYRLASKLAVIQNKVNTSIIDPATATTFDAEGAINLATINKVGFFYHRVGSLTSARVILVRNLLAIANSILTGGSAGKPLDIRFLDVALNGWGYTGLCEKQGDAVLVKTDVQFGDGTIPTYVDTTATLLNTPIAYSTGLQPFWNAAANSITVGMKAASGDTMNFVASAMAAGAGAEQNFTIDPATSATGNYSFQGEVISNFLFTGDTDAPVTGATYSGDDEVAFKGATVTNTTVSNTTSTDAACSWDANPAADIDSCTFDGTGALYAIELGTAVTAITLTDVTFTGTPATDKVHVLKTLTNVAAGAFVVGVHYRINTVGSTDFTAIGASANTIGVNFTATGVGSGTGTADQAVKITISGTTALIESDCTTAGAPVWVAAPQPTLSATVLANTRCLLWNRTTSAELDNAFVAGTSWSKIITSGASSNDVLDLYTFKEGYEESVATIIYSGANASFAVSQATDDAIQYYRTEESITDYTTLTEFNFYSPDIYIQADDADGESTLKKLFIFYNGVLTTADGATYMRGGVTFNSAFDVVINRSVRAIAVDNVSVTQGLHFTDESTIRVTTDDGTSWIAPPSAPGSIRYAFGVSPGQIETGVSGVDAQDITDIANAAAAAVVADGKTLTVPKFLGLK